MTGKNSWIGSRLLLRQLRDAMAGGGTAQQRLDSITQIIARGMIAEVCSVYVMRPGDVLELFATEGLRKDAVHRTRLRLGEGLVGDVAARARPLALADAQSHPLFAYRPETGEEIYHSLLGVPILRGGRVLGVLVIQNQTRRNYAEEETETLETVAMLVAELIAGGELVQPEELLPADGIALRPLRLQGVRLNGGLGMGLAVLHKRGATITQVVAEDPERELQRFAEAMGTMQTALDSMLETYGHEDAELGGGGEHLDILRTYRMIAKDRGWIGRIREAIRSGLTAEAAVAKVQNDTRARMQQVSDPYLRERLLDLEDIAFRLLQHLAGKTNGSCGVSEMPDDAVLIARAMGPAELLDYDTTKVRALVLEDGSPTSHVAIVARALDMPVIGNVRDVLSKVEPLDPVLVDGDHALLAVRPSEEVQQSFMENLAVRDRRKAAHAAARNLPAVTRDGVRVMLQINAGLLIDLPHLHDTGAEGIGLFRTEIPFMIRSEFPGVAAQAGTYGRVLDAAAGKPVVFRTLDIGGDKLLPYFRGTADENPAMGWRAIRIGLDRPAMLRQQLRALIRAAAGRDLRVMFPMVSEVAEFDAARRLLDLELARAERSGRMPAHVAVGVMLEVPALLFQMPALLRRIDFLSVGSNDLIQFLFASDRGNPRVSNRYDVLSPAVLGFLRSVLEVCAAADIPVNLCGEMAGNPLEAMALVGLGFRRLSMPPGSIDAVRVMVRSLDVGALKGYLDSLVESPDHSLRGRLRAFAQDHNIVV